MPEQQEPLTPTDSVSNAPKGRKRPGKAQRAAARSASVVTANTSQASLPNAQNFARKMNYDPVPQPGKFPVVFPAGAGEPTKDEDIAISGVSLRMCLGDIPAEYVNSARYAEFSQNAGIDDDDFAKEIVTSGLLGLAQHIVHAHQNMGLPLGDFSAVSSTDMYNFAAIRAIIRQFGEFAVDNLGTRFLYKSYEDEVTALVRTSKQVKNHDAGVFNHILDRHWLPVRLGDKRTAYIIAGAIREYFKGFGLHIPIETLYVSVFSKAPGIYDAMKAVLPQEKEDMFDPLFKPYKTKAEFKAVFTAGSEQLLKELKLPWDDPKCDHLDFSVIPKIDFPDIASGWLRKKTTVCKFFTCGSGQVEKSDAVGSPAQLATREVVAGVTVVRNLVAISAPEFSLFACYPATMVYPQCAERNVVLTTSISTKARATEFLQRDWQ